MIVDITWAIALGVRRLAYTWAQHTEGDSSTEILIARLGYGEVWVIGSVVALGVLKLDFGERSPKFNYGGLRLRPMTDALAVQTNPNTTLEHPNGQRSMEGEDFAK